MHTFVSVMPDPRFFREVLIFVLLPIVVAIAGLSSIDILERAYGGYIAGISRDFNVVGTSLSNYILRGQLVLFTFFVTNAVTACLVLLVIYLMLPVPGSSKYIIFAVALTGFIVFIVFASSGTPSFKVLAQDLFMEYPLGSWRAIWKNGDTGEGILQKLISISNFVFVFASCFILASNFLFWRAWQADELRQKDLRKFAKTDKYRLAWRRRVNATLSVASGILTLGLFNKSVWTFWLIPHLHQRTGALDCSEKICRAYRDVAYADVMAHGLFFTALLFAIFFVPIAELCCSHQVSEDETGKNFRILQELAQNMKSMLLPLVPTIASVMVLLIPEP